MMGLVLEALLVEQYSKVLLKKVEVQDFRRAVILLLGV